MSFKIESDVPMPPNLRKQWPFAHMNVGDSFLVSPSDYHKAQVAAVQHAKWHGVKFATRRVNGGYRIWRTA